MYVCMYAVLVYVYRYVVGELFRGYLVERDEAMFSEKQRRVNTFMKTPRELEKVCHTPSYPSTCLSTCTV